MEVSVIPPGGFGTGASFTSPISLVPFHVISLPGKLVSKVLTVLGSALPLSRPRVRVETNSSSTAGARTGKKRKRGGGSEHVPSAPSKSLSTTCHVISDGSFSHIKRVKSSSSSSSSSNSPFEIQVALCPVVEVIPNDLHLWVLSTIADILSCSRPENALWEQLPGVSVAYVPLTPPITDDQWVKASTEWPLSTPLPGLNAPRAALLPWTPEQIPALEAWMRVVGEAEKENKVIGPISCPSSVAVIVHPDGNLLMGVGVAGSLSQGASADASASPPLLTLPSATRHAVMTAIADLSSVIRSWPAYSKESPQVPSGEDLVLAPPDEMTAAAVLARSVQGAPSNLIPPPPAWTPYLATGADIILSYEPCVMCSMALVHSRIRRVIFNHRNQVYGGLASSSTAIHGQPTLNHHFAAISGVSGKGGTVKPLT